MSDIKLQDRVLYRTWNRARDVISIPLRAQACAQIGKTLRGRVGERVRMPSVRHIKHRLWMCIKRQVEEEL